MFLIRSRFIDSEPCDYCACDPCRCAPSEVCPECGECTCECEDEEGDEDDEESLNRHGLETSYVGPGQGDLCDVTAYPREES